MTKDFKMIINRIHIFIYFILIIMFGTLLLGCTQNEKIYLDYDEVILHSYHKDILSLNSSFTIYYEEDKSYLNRSDENIIIRKWDYLEKIKITPIDTAIKKLSKITFDNLHIEEEKGLPQIYIVKKDTINDEIKIIEVGQSFVISEDNFEF